MLDARAQAVEFLPQALRDARSELRMEVPVRTYFLQPLVGIDPAQIRRPGEATKRAGRQGVLEKLLHCVAGDVEAGEVERLNVR